MPSIRRRGCVLSVVLLGLGGQAMAAGGAWAAAAVTERVSVTGTGAQAANGGVIFDLSGDGRYALLLSRSALTPGATGGQLFVRDRVLGTVRRASSPLPGPAPRESFYESGAISDDGRYVAFTYSRTAPGGFDTHVYVRDLRAGTTVQADVTPTGGTGNSLSRTDGGGAISADGRHVVFQSSPATWCPATPTA